MKEMNELHDDFAQLHVAEVVERPAHAIEHPVYSTTAQIPGMKDWVVKNTANITTNRYAQNEIAKLLANHEELKSKITLSDDMDNPDRKCLESQLLQAQKYTALSTRLASGVNVCCFDSETDEPYFLQTVQKMRKNYGSCYFARNSETGQVEGVCDSTSCSFGLVSKKENPRKKMSGKHLLQECVGRECNKELSCQRKDVTTKLQKKKERKGSSFLISLGRMSQEQPQVFCKKFQTASPKSRMKLLVKDKLSSYFGKCS